MPSKKPTKPAAKRKEDISPLSAADRAKIKELARPVREARERDRDARRGTVRRPERRRGSGASPAAHERDREARAAEKTAGEHHVLEWWRQHVGPLPRAPVDDPYLVPLGHAGPAARLLRADLTDKAGADAFMRRMARVKGAPTPSLADLRKGAALVRFVGLAIRSGSALEWTYVRDAYGAIFESTTIRRLVVLDAVQHAVSAVQRVRETRKWAAQEGIDDDEADASAVVREAAAEAREICAEADAAFASLDVDTFVAEVDGAERGDLRRDGQPKGGAGNKWTVGIAARLAVQCGAFGEQNADKARKNFLNAQSAAPRTSEPSSGS